MNTYVIWKGTNVVAILVCNDFVRMSDEHQNRLRSAGYSVTFHRKEVDYAHNPEAIPAFVDKLLK